LKRDKNRFDICMHYSRCQTRINSTSIIREFQEEKKIRFVDFFLVIEVLVISTRLLTHQLYRTSTGMSVTLPSAYCAVRQFFSPSFYYTIISVVIILTCELGSPHSWFRYIVSHSHAKISLARPSYYSRGP